MARTVPDGRATGNLAHDAHIAALAIEHGVMELWTLDRDFARSPDFRCTIRSGIEALAANSKCSIREVTQSL